MEWYWVCANELAFDEKSVTQETFHSLYSSLLDIMIVGELPERKKISPNPVLTLQFFRTIEGATDIEVQYWEYDEASMSVNVNGQGYEPADPCALFTCKGQSLTCPIQRPSVNRKSARFPRMSYRAWLAAHVSNKRYAHSFSDCNRKPCRFVWEIKCKKLWKTNWR